MDAERLAQIQALLAAAEPGDWEVKTVRAHDFQSVRLAGGVFWDSAHQAENGDWIDSPDIDLVAAAPTVIRELLAYVDQLIGERDRARDLAIRAGAFD